VGAAEVALADDQKLSAKAAWDAEERARQDAATKQLLADASAAGAPVAVLLGKGRQAALNLLRAAGPYTRAAAEAALEGTEVEMRHFLAVGLTAAEEQDDRARVAEIAATGAPAALRVAAEQALTGSVQAVREFLNTKAYSGRANDDMAAILAIHTSGGIATKKAAKAALEGSPAARQAFLATGQYVAAKQDEQAAILSILSTAPPTSREVRASAKIALAGPESYMRGFLQVEYARAQQRDLLAATHEARVAASVAEAARAATQARHDAKEAAAAAARAAKADADAARYAADANTAAEKANGYAHDASESAKQARESAQKAAEAAARARDAAAAAQADARKADRSAEEARYSALEASRHADDARKDAEKAKASAEAAGQSADEAAAAYDSAYAMTLERINKQDAELRKNPPKDDGRHCDRPPGYGADPSCYGNLPRLNRDKDDGEITCYTLPEEDHTQCGYSVITPAQRKAFEQQRDQWENMHFCMMFIPGCFAASTSAMAVADGEIDADDAELLALNLATSRMAAMTREFKLLNKVPCKNSFSADTRVLMADGTTKPISAIQRRDRVLAGDPGYGSSKAAEVTKVHRNVDSELANVRVRGAHRVVTTLHTTEHHPFWVDDRRAWLDAGRLTPGDHLLTANGRQVVVDGVRRFTGSREMYNLTVADLHTFYVLAGNAPVLVHNGCIPMSSKIGEDSLLTRAAEEAANDAKVQRDLDNMFKQLSEGNANTGMGMGAIKGTDVLYARGRNGGRLYFRYVDKGIQIVGKSSKNKSNQQSVINRLTELYGK
jgi:hypothetical protein